MAQQGIDKRIDLKGIVRNTAGSNAPDGELDEIVNLRFKDGHFIPMNNHAAVPGLKNVRIDYSYIYIHSNAYQHMVGVKDNSLYYFADIDDEGNVTMKSPAARLCDVNVTDEVGVQYTQTGNLLTIIDGGILKYTYWRKNRYDNIPSNYNGEADSLSLAPDGRIDFRVEPRKFSQNGNMIRAVRSDDKYKSNIFWGNSFISSVDERRRNSLGLMMKSRGISREKGEPTGYFMVCTAIKLYDGSYILQSRPLLMTPPNPLHAKADFEKNYNCRRIIANTDDNEFGAAVNGVSSKSYKDNTYWEFGTQNTTNAKSFSFNPYTNANLNLMYHTDGYYELAYTDYDNASGYIGALGNIWGLSKGSDKGDGDSTSDKHDKMVDLVNINQHFAGTYRIPDLTCLYGNNTYKEDKFAAQADNTFKTYGFMHTYNKDPNVTGYTLGVPRHETSNAQAVKYGICWRDSTGRLKYRKNWMPIGEKPNWYFNSQNNILGGDMIIPEHCASNKKGSYIWCLNMPHVLQYRINSNIDKSYEDIIDSVCVFMTEEIEPTKIHNDDYLDYLKAREMRCAVVAHGYLGQKMAWTNTVTNSKALPLYTKVYTQNNPNIGENYVIERKSNDEISEELKKLKNFYLVKEIKFKDFKAGTWVNIDMEKDGLLLNLVQQETLNLDAADRNAYRPMASLMYNGRLHFANYRQDLFYGFPLEYFYWFSSNNQASINAVNAQYPETYHRIYVKNEDGSRRYMYKIEIDIETNNGLEIVSRYYIPPENGGIASRDIYSLNPFLSYPDIRAKKMRISVQGYNSSTGYNGVWQAEFSLTPHDFLPIAYYMNPELKPITLTDEKHIVKRYYNSLGSYQGGIEHVVWSNFDENVHSNTTNEFVPNGVKVSATDNPLYFPIGNTYRIGNTGILAMATNSIAVSDGQVGAMPLFVFANDGVYGLFVDASGMTAYSNSRPICRDICNNWRSVTYTDAGVAFSTDRGVMLLSGSTPSDMSDMLEGTPLNVDDSSLGKLQEVWKSAVTSHSLVDLDSSMTREHFLEYVKKAIIGYNSFDRELWVSKPEATYSYVYLFNSQMWIKRSISCKQYINNYPLTYMLNDNELTVLGKETDSGNDVMFLTRPIKSGDQEFKSAYRTILRGLFSVKGEAEFDDIDARNIDMTPKWHRQTIEEKRTVEITVNPNEEYIAEWYPRTVEAPKDGGTYVHDLSFISGVQTSDIPTIKIIVGKTIFTDSGSPQNGDFFYDGELTLNEDNGYYYASEGTTLSTTKTITIGIYYVEAIGLYYNYRDKIVIEEDTEFEDVYSFVNGLSPSNVGFPTFNLDDVTLKFGNVYYPSIINDVTLSNVVSYKPFVFYRELAQSEFTIDENGVPKLNSWSPESTIDRNVLTEAIKAQNELEEFGDYTFEYNGVSYTLKTYQEGNTFLPYVIPYMPQGTNYRFVYDVEDREQNYLYGYEFIVKLKPLTAVDSGDTNIRTIFTHEFLENCIKDVYEEIDKTNYPDDIIPLSVDCNITIIDYLNVIDGEPALRKFYNKDSDFIDYNNLPSGYAPDTQITFANTDVSFLKEDALKNYCVEITYKSYDSDGVEQNRVIEFYNDISTINGVENAAQLLAKYDDDELSPIEDFDDAYNIRLETGKITRFIDKNGVQSVFKLWIRTIDGWTKTETVWVKYAELRDKMARQLPYGSITDVTGQMFTYQTTNSLDTVIKRAGIYLFGSYDARKWAFLGGNEKGGTFRDLGTLVERLDCKYFRILFVGCLNSNSSFEYIDMSVISRILAGKLR